MMDDYHCRIGGAACTLRYSVNAMCAAEDMAGRALASPEDKPFSSVRLMLWSGLLESRPRLTLEEAGEIMDVHLDGGGTLAEISEHCENALRRAGFLPPVPAEA